MAVIGEGAVGYAMGRVDMVIVGAEGVVENGGIISRPGTYQIGLLARAVGKSFYVIAESHKFVWLYPLSQYDLPIEQKVIDFRTMADEEEMATNVKIVDMAFAETGQTELDSETHQQGWQAQLKVIELRWVQNAFLCYSGIKSVTTMRYHPLYLT